MPGLAITTAALNVPEIFKNTFNACLSEGIFPKLWNIQRLVLLPKVMLNTDIIFKHGHLMKILIESSKKKI